MTCGRRGWLRSFVSQCVVVVLCTASYPAARVRAAADAGTNDADRLRELDALMVALRQESLEAAQRIQGAYGENVGEGMLADRAALALALSTGAIRQLPRNAQRFNVQTRLSGPHPIGEKDLPYQGLYVAGHPAALGCLLHVAAVAQSGPLEVTSLVRHLAYQQALQQTNANARVGVPMHARGLAFDIPVLKLSPSAAADIRDALRQLRDAGFLFFIAETRQFVFHVVPAPDHLAFYAELFDALTSLPDPAATPAQTAREPLQAIGILAPSQKQVWSGAYGVAPYAHAVWPLVVVCVVGVIITGWRRKGS
jgi:hypothetical protein